MGTRTVLKVRRGLTPTPVLVMALLLSLLVVLIGAGPAAAHNEVDGTVIVNVDDENVIVMATVDFAELGFTDTTGDGLIDSQELADQQDDVASTLVDTVRDQVELTVDGDTLELIGAGVSPIGHADGEDPVPTSSVSLLLASAPHDGDVSDVMLDWGLEGPSATVAVAHSEGVISGELSDDGTLSVSLDPRSAAASFFNLGVEHIRSGPDHVLFLLVLTLAVVGTTVSRETTWRTVNLVTAFTIGHALSLGLAYFDLVSVPAWIVEPAISLSIVAAAVLAIRGRANEARPWIAALIGLVHGLGFASSLGSFGVATSQQAVALTAFNVGIDVAQTVVVLLIIGGLWLAGQVAESRMVWIRTSVASAAAVTGVAWTVTRLMDIPL